MYNACKSDQNWDESSHDGDGLLLNRAAYCDDNDSSPAVS